MDQKRDFNKIKIAFPLLWNKDWMGGYNYYKTLIDEIILNYPDKIVPIIFTYPNFPEEFLCYFKDKGIKIIYTNVFCKDIRIQVLLGILLKGNNEKLNKLFSENNIQIIFENSFFFGWRVRNKIIAWIPDFQHKELKKNFSFFNRYKREFGFILQVITKRKILLSSNDAKEKFLKYYPFSKKKNIHVLSFTKKKEKINFLNISHKIKTFSKIQYFLICNQFYEHKNHLIVLKAMHYIKNKYKVNVKLVLTGSKISSNDNTKFFDNFIENAKSFSIYDNINYLEFVNYDELLFLIDKSQAYINPSFYEGWNTTVEMAKNLKKQIILSNIKVHIEQLGKNAHFFEPNNFKELGEIMFKIKNDNFNLIDDYFLDKNYKSFSRNFKKLIFQS